MRKVSSKFDPHYWREVYMSERFPDEYWNDLAASGLFGTLIEKKWGGMEKSLLDLTLATQETAERYAGIASYLYLSGCLVSNIFAKNGSEEQKKEFIPRLAKGELKISIALTEEKSGLDSLSLETTAAKSGNGYVISGKKMLVNNVDRADYLIIFARTTQHQGEKKSFGISMFLVDPKDPMIRARKLEKLGMDFLGSFATEFKDLKVNSDRLIGEQDRGWQGIVNSFNMDRVATSASLIGTGKLALSQASEYAKQRMVFGRAIGSNQGIQFPMADAMVQLLAAEAVMLKAASLAVNGENFVNETNLALLASVNAASAATDAAMQAFGGHGYLKDYDVERYWRDVRLHKVHPISTELLLAAIAQKSLGLPKSY